MTLGATNHTDIERPKHDFYATDPKTVELLLKRIATDNIELPKTIYEPACGQGHISEVLKKHGFNVISSDLYDYGYGTPNIDFLKRTEKMDCIITNPPYNVALEFAKKSVEVLKPNGYAILLLRIQFLEGKQRNLFFKLHPPKYVYVHSSRQYCAINGDFTGQKSSATCYAWFVWQKGFTGEPTIKWID